VLLICAATACFATLDAVIKALSARYPVPLLVWARWSKRSPSGVLPCR